MDIAAWQHLHHSDPSLATQRWLEQSQLLPAAQREAVWAWITDAPAEAFAGSDSGPLAGVPFAVKDLFPVAGVPTLAGGTLPTRPARRTSHFIRACTAQGAVLVGKTHLHEFAYGLTGDNPHYGPVTHPRHPTRDAGGSSSGSAAAVAAGVVLFALGTDTAGSLRVPAAYCGLFAWRGQPGADDITDAFPLAPSFDTAGWLAASAADNARIWHALHATPDPLERTPRGAYLPPVALGLSADDDTSATLAAAAARFTPHTCASDGELARACRDVDTTYSILQSTEAFAVHQATLDRQRAHYGSAVWQRIDRGRHWTAAQMDAARRHALLIRAAYDNYFADHDFLVTPITLSPAPLITATDPRLRDTLLKLNTHVSIAGRPALAVPVPVADDLTLGLQIVFNSTSSSAIPPLLERCISCYSERS